MDEFKSIDQYAEWLEGDTFNTPQGKEKQAEYCAQLVGLTLRAALEKDPKIFFFWIVNKQRQETVEGKEYTRQGTFAESHLQTNIELKQNPFHGWANVDVYVDEQNVITAASMDFYTDAAYQ
jgi:hypothetical protein